MLEHSNTPKVQEELPKRNKIKVIKIILWTFLSIILIVISCFGTFLFKYPKVAKALYNFAKAPTNEITTYNERINILLMGKAGGTRDGADLTDTIMLISLPTVDGKIAAISIPRDIWIPEIRAKINSAYYWGKTGSVYFTIPETGGGFSLVKDVAGKVTGQTIQYGIVVDFSAFKDIVDAIGGISVNVRNGFTDKLYPIEGRENDLCDGDQTYSCRYETVTFSPGFQNMNGETALKYVRSRHAEGEEGTDLARETRQQEVIEAIKEKILQPRTYLSAKNIKALISITGRYTETDIDLPTVGVLARKVLDNIKNISQTSIPEDLLVVPPASKTFDNLYVFIPKAGNGNWSEIQNWFSQALE